MPPINLARSGSTTSSVSFSWNQNSNNGGAAVFDYAIYWDAGDSTLQLTQFVEAQDTTYNMTTYT